MTGGFIVLPGEGRELGAAATRPTVKIGPHAGSERIGLLESEIPPGGGFASHVHDDHEEAFYVLEGSVEYRIDDAWHVASAGSTVFIPAGHVHAFRNPGDQPARHLAIGSPADAMTMIEQLVAAPDHSAEILDRYRSRLTD